MERPSADDARRRRFELLFDRHRWAVLGYALRRVEDAADAADVLATTFLVAWRRLDDVPNGDAARAWLLAAARRALANERRGNRRRHALAERLGRELTVELSTIGSDAGRDGTHVWQALAQLSDEDREVLLLAGWEELEPAQIGVVLGVRGVTARSRLHRARRRLRALLDADGDDGAAHPATHHPHLDLASEEAR